MKLLIVRHAPAGDKTAYAKTGKSDSSRPLTAGGRRKMKKAARGLKNAAPGIRVIAASPLKRARETAEILRAFLPNSRLVEWPELSPDRPPRELIRALGRLSTRGIPALVGHEPHLSRVIRALTGAAGLQLALKKGGACLLEFEKAPAAGAAKLRWFLTPAQLRLLGR